jgi:hypothetical protein
MKDFLFKLFILRIILKDGITGAFEYWKSEIYHKDLDQHTCCDGQLCGCRGMTIREEWSINTDKSKSKTELCI